MGLWTISLYESILLPLGKQSNELHLWWIWLSAKASCGRLCRPCPSVRFYPFSRDTLASSPPGFGSAITPDIPVSGFTGAEEAGAGCHHGQAQLQERGEGTFHCCAFPTGRLSLICWLISGGEIHFWSVCLDCCDTHPCRHLWHPLAARALGGLEQAGVLVAKSCSPPLWCDVKGLLCSDIPAAHAEPQ